MVGYRKGFNNSNKIINPTTVNVFFVNMSYMIGKWLHNNIKSICAVESWVIRWYVGTWVFKHAYQGRECSGSGQSI
jgi:hypothetical protein